VCGAKIVNCGFRFSWERDAFVGVAKIQSERPWTAVLVGQAALFATSARGIPQRLLARQVHPFRLKVGRLARLHLRTGVDSAISRPAMSNRAIWNVRLRHEWLRKPKKGKRLKNRDRVRLGMNLSGSAEAPKSNQA